MKRVSRTSESYKNLSNDGEKKAGVASEERTIVRNNLFRGRKPW